MIRRVLFIVNTPSHYRMEIYQKLSQCGVDFYFSDLQSSIKSFDFSVLNSEPEVGGFLGKESKLHFVRGAVQHATKYKAVVAAGNLRSLHVWLILINSFFLRRNVYLWSHGWYGREGFIKKIIKKIFFGLAYKVFTYNEKAKDLMVEEGFKPEKILPIYNSLAYDYQLNIRETLKEGSDSSFRTLYQLEKPYFFFIGRLSEQKNLELILRAMAGIESKEFYLLIIGPEVDGGRFRETAESLGLLGRVRFTGGLYDETSIAKLVSSGIACIAPGNVGLTAVHSMTYGTPVITHNNYSQQMPEVETVVEGKTGSLFEYESVESLQECMVSYLDKTDEQLRQMKNECEMMIDQKWNSRNQLKIFKEELGI